MFRLTPSEHLSQNEIDAAEQMGFGSFNVQNQEKVTWDPTPAVARAYIDQLLRRNGMRVAHATTLDGLLDRVASGTRDGELLDEIDTVAAGLESDAAALPGSAAKLRLLAGTLTSLTGNLR